MNPILKFLIENKVKIPALPQDYSKIISDAAVRRLYVIVMTGRSGSTWLATALNEAGRLGYPLEYFSEEGLPYYWKYESEQNFSDVFRGILESHATDGVFGFKMDPTRLSWLSRIVDLRKTFGGAQCSWIHMKRLNIVKQSFSFARAKFSGVWHHYSGEERQLQRRPTLSELEPEVWSSIRSILFQEREMDEFYNANRIVPLEIMYEEIFDSKQQLLMRVAATIDPNHDMSFSETIDGKTERLSDALDQETELEFLRKHIHRITKIMNRRGYMEVDEIDELCTV